MRTLPFDPMSADEAATGPSANPARRASGVLLINLGTPDAPDAPSVKRYLAEFLSDPRVIEIPQICVAADPSRDHPQHPPGEERACLSASVDRSRLAAGRDHAAAGARRCSSGWPDVRVEFAMRYGNPGHCLGPARDEGRGLRAHPAGAALPAILRRHDRDRQRRRFCGAGRDALAAGAADAAALS